MSGLSSVVRYHNIRGLKRHKKVLNGSQTQKTADYCKQCSGGVPIVQPPIAQIKVELSHEA